MGAAALATLPVYVASFSWMADLLHTFTRSSTGYLAFNLARYAICLAVMLPSTFCAGMTLPLITRTLIVSGHGERSIGWVYGINTFGAIVGVILASLVLLPAIGLKALLVSGATLDMGLGVLLFAFAWRAGATSRILVAGAAAATALCLFVVAQGVRLDRALLVSGVYRTAVYENSSEVLFYDDGRTATVAAGRDPNGTIFVSTNGKADASLHPEWFAEIKEGSHVTMVGDSVTQVVLPLVALAHAPAAREIALIGHGSGMSSHFLLGSPSVERVVTIEIEPAMIRGSRAFYPANARVFEDPRSVFVIDDAKSFFAANDERYDLILSDAEVKEILDRVWQWKNWVLADRTPPDWDIWARQTVLVEQDLHQGTVGVVDEAFYETLHAYLDRHSPPLDVCAAFTFLEAVRRWDFAPAAKLSAPLVEKAAANESVIPVDRLLAGAVTAAIATGNPTAAEQYVERLGGQLPADLWLKLLRSYARADGGLPTPGASAGHVQRSCRPS
jgi:hypothetical protein